MKPLTIILALLIASAAVNYYTRTDVMPVAELEQALIYAVD